MSFFKLYFHFFYKLLCIILGEEEICNFLNNSFEYLCFRFLQKCHIVNMIIIYFKPLQNVELGRRDWFTCDMLNYRLCET